MALSAPRIVPTRWTGVLQESDDALHQVSTVDTGPEGQAQFEITNQGETSLLVRFVDISMDVPNPTVDP